MYGLGTDDKEVLEKRSLRMGRRVLNRKDKRMTGRGLEMMA